jgi:hypothetical protein
MRGTFSLLKRSSRRGSRRSGFVEESSEIPSAVRSWEVAQGLSLSVLGRRQRVIGTRFIGESGFPEPRVLCMKS